MLNAAVMCVQHLEESLKRLQDERDEAEVRLGEVCLESQQVNKPHQHPFIHEE